MAKQNGEKNDGPFQNGDGCVSSPSTAYARTNKVFGCSRLYTPDAGHFYVWHHYIVLYER